MAFAYVWKLASGGSEIVDIATILGLLLGIGLIIGSIMTGGSGPFIHVPSLMITVGGTIAATLINFPLGKRSVDLLGRLTGDV